MIDCDHRTPKRESEGMPYVTIPEMKNGRIDLERARKISEQDFESWTRKALPRTFDVVLSRRTNPGETALVRRGQEFALGQNLVLLRSTGDRLHRPYLYWVTRSPAWWREVEKFINVGAVFDSLRIADIRHFRVPAPPMADQIAIAAALGALDDKIELNRRMNETLASIAQELFRQWNRQAEHGDARSTKATNSWMPGVLGDLAELTMGQSPPGSTYNSNGDGLPFFQGATDFGVLFPTNRIYCTAPTRLARAGDTLISVRAPVGRANIAREDCAIGRGVAAIRSKFGSHPAFTWCLVASLADALNVFNGEGTVFGSINKKSLHSLPVRVPPAEAIDALEAVAGPILKRLRASEDESRTLTSIRDTLLPKLISGELRIPDAERLVSEVT